MEQLWKFGKKDLHSQLLKYYELIYHEFYEGIDHPVYCRSCREVVSGPAYVIDHPVYNQSFHKSCADLPRQIQHPLHPQHHLTAAIVGRYEGEDQAYSGFICDGCRHYSSGVRYGCDECRLNFDVRCVSKPEIQQLALKERIEIATPFHVHKLQLFYLYMLLPTESFENIICCCCSKGFQGSAYACIECRFFIHESCIDKIPQQVKSSVHPNHPLLIRQADRTNIYDNFCLACQRQIHGLKLKCERCIANDYHISCCTRATSGLRLKYHEEHPMLYVVAPFPTKNCVVCDTTCENCAYYGCLDCEVFVHTECIPLPRVIKHECHPYHALSLSDSTHVLKITSNEYRCIVCEKEGDPIYPCYYCEECPIPEIAHIDCVLSEEDPPSEKLEYLVPRSRDESDKEIDKTARRRGELDEETDKAARSRDELDKETDKAEKETKEQCRNESEQESFEPEEESFGTEQEWKSDLEGSSLAEIDEMIQRIQKRINKLVSKLEVVQKLRTQKLNSLF